MPQIQWSSNYAIGVKEIDTQHQELVNNLNQLLEACAQGKGKEAINEMIGFLGEYVSFHFATEERFMKQWNYPDAPAHIQEHRNFIQTVDHLRREIAQETIGPGTVIKVNRIVTDWLINHIIKVDTKLGAFLKKNKVE